MLLCSKRCIPNGPLNLIMLQVMGPTSFLNDVLCWYSNFQGKMTGNSYYEFHWTLKWYIERILWVFQYQLVDCFAPVMGVFMM